MTVPPGNDTHADTNLGGETPVLDEQRRVSPDGVDDAVVVGPSHPAGEGWRWPTLYEHYLAMLDERDQAASQRDRERARADRAEAALERAAAWIKAGRDANGCYAGCEHVHGFLAHSAACLEAQALLEAALSAGSGGRETTPDLHDACGCADCEQKLLVAESLRHTPNDADARGPGVTGPSSERTADADVATLRDYVDLLEYGHPNGWDERHYDALAALDRLVERNQQLQEALEPFTHYDFAASQWIAGLTHEGHELRALWAEDVEALKGHVARARAALASVRARET